MRSMILCTKTDLFNLNFIFITPRVQTKGLIFSGDNPIDVQLVNFLLLFSNVSELRIGEETNS